MAGSDRSLAVISCRVFRLLLPVIRTGCQQPPSDAARTAMMTAACWAVDNRAHVLLNVDGLGSVLDCSSLSIGSTRVVGSPPLDSIHLLAAIQACAYWSSVDSAGTSTRVVTPSGDMPIGPRCVPSSTDCCGRADGAGAADVACPPLPEEHAIKAAAVAVTTTAEANSERHR